MGGTACGFGNEGYHSTSYRSTVTPLPRGLSAGRVLRALEVRGTVGWHTQHAARLFMIDPKSQIASRLEAPNPACRLPPAKSCSVLSSHIKQTSRVPSHPTTNHKATSQSICIEMDASRWLGALPHEYAVIRLPALEFPSAAPASSAQSIKAIRFRRRKNREEKHRQSVR